MLFEDRHDAGRRLAWLLEKYRQEQPVVLGLPRGGVVVAYEVARALGAPLDVLIVRKIGVPGAEEFAMGATAAGSTLVDAELVRRLRIPPAVVDAIVRRETAELHRREALYRGARAPVEVRGRTVLVVDDGLATGATAQAAVRALRARAPRRIVFAAPVCSQEGAAALRGVADSVECLECPADMWAVGYWYRDFSAATDAEVIQCLRPVDEGKVPA
ncbi:MAG TPA: phosphoribosyltransferase family protein [Gemmatimonadales bacterium]|nr:phosphoribosyltransferase family protein [Gemmatimonadales bacterium]